MQWLKSSPGRIAAGAVEAGDKTACHWVAARQEHNWNRRGCRFCRHRRRGIPDNHGHLPLQKLGDQSRQPVVLAAGPSIFNGHVLTLDETDFLQPLAERGHIGHWCAGCITRPDEADEWDGLLRARRERPCCRVANQGDELASRHSITSSAMASSRGGKLRPNALAVLRLITSSNLVDCMTGRSAGFSPLRIRPVYTPAWRYASVMLVP